MNGGGFDAIEEELLGELVGAVAGADEDQNLAPFPLADEVRQHLPLAAPFHRIDRLGHGVGGNLAPRHFNPLRLIEEFIGKLLDA